MNYDVIIFFLVSYLKLKIKWEHFMLIKSGSVEETAA